MIREIGMVMLGVFMFFCGMGMVEMAVTDPEFELLARVFMSICGLILLAGGVVVAVLYGQEVRGYMGGSGIKEKVAPLLDELREEVSADVTPVSADASPTEKLIRSFREHYAAFFDHGEAMGNDPIQADATQLCWHTLHLQKQRLDRKGVRCHLESERLRYGDMSPVRARERFDGKYRVIDVSETIQATQSFIAAGGKTLHVKKNAQTAWYRILRASQQGGDRVICPNCGSVSTRENLIDGCDYCGTKFAVEDLGARVSAFGMRPDYEVEYARYQAARETYQVRVGLIIGIPVAILCLAGAFVYGGGLQSPYTLSIAAIMFTVAFPTFAAVYVGEILFWMFVFPAIQAKASLTYYGKRQLERMRERRRQDHDAETRVRKADPLFSIAGFYSEVQNELCAIHFSEGVGDAAAFTHDAQAEAQVTASIPGYRDCIDMAVEDIFLANYQVNGALQEAEVEAELVLLFEDAGRTTVRREQVRLRLVKASACKTQAVCGPSFTTCRNCGASLSLLEGRGCPYCGTARNLSDFGWAISAYVAR